MHSLPRVLEPAARTSWCVRSLAPLKRPYRPLWWVGGINFEGVCRGKTVSLLGMSLDTVNEVEDSEQQEN